MTFDEALKHLKSPRDKRPVWLGGVLQLHLTRACTLACAGCTQLSNVGGKTSFVSLEHFKLMMQALNGYWGVVGFFGGQPTLHPNFFELCAIARSYFPQAQLGLWTQDLNGHGAVCRETFNPAVSNINLHQDIAAQHEFERTWPESMPYLKGLMEESKHCPPYVAIDDMEDVTESEMWATIATCDVSALWSAMICVVNGKPLLYFCEIAGAMAMMYNDDSVGMELYPGVWDQPIEAFRAQVAAACPSCGMSMRGRVPADVEMVSKRHLAMYRPKTPRDVQLITKRSQLGVEVERATDYLTHGMAKKEG